MKIHPRHVALIAAIATGAATSASAQSVLFDFNNAPLHSPLPITLTVGGITAHFSGTGQGYSIQDTSAPVVPIGFTGRFIYPSSVFPADLLISFDQTLTEFSILYSPQELACDDSATMRVTADMNGNFVGTNTTTASNPGTWPVETLACSFPQGFNSVVVHYDAHPPTCQDWGPIFLADDMRVTPMGVGVTPFCFGDGTGAPCPCGNSGSPGHGCDNSIATGGGLLGTSGAPILSADTLHLIAWNERPTAFSLFWQGDAEVAPHPFGDGIGCMGGPLKRLYFHNAVGGVVTAPQGADPAVSARSAALGDPISPGTIRVYHVFYRDPDPNFCPAPIGSTINTTNGVRVLWGG
jgi:hypothetical protein